MKRRVILTLALLTTITISASPTRTANTASSGSFSCALSILLKPPVKATPYVPALLMLSSQDGCQSVHDECRQTAQEARWNCEARNEEGSDSYTSCWCQGERAYEACMRRSSSCGSNWRIEQVRQLSIWCFTPQ